MTVPDPLDKRSADALRAARAPRVSQFGPADGAGIWVNDVHAQLNRTRVRTVCRPTSTAAVQRIVRRANDEGAAISIAGGRHAMGGQQFGRDAVLIDTTGLDRVIGFDPEEGTVQVGAGIQWPKLIPSVIALQRDAPLPWGIRQKQTGADRLSLGGALAANVHGRGLGFKPLIDDVESFLLVDAGGELRRCSRTENAELFRLAIGGYGLFGIVVQVTLRLSPRTRLRRDVEIIDIEDVMAAFEARIADGYLYGDFQFSTDPGSDGFLRRGVLACYRPVDPATPMPGGQREFSREDWLRLLHLGHTDRARAFELYTRHYLATGGQIYWSDSHQLGTYIDDYHRQLDRELGAATPASEMITEIFVPRDRLVDFMAAARKDFLRHEVDFIYGTIRLIEQDRESFLAWARQPYACIVFNLHVPHSPAGLVKAAADFRRLIDRGLERGGSFFLTYHRWATREQTETAYPQFAEFLRLKRHVDPAERFQSSWYRHHKALFEGRSGDNRETL
ncbi:MAG TPA: FAD-binding oxidoreductase [Kiloniellales bacterium]